MPLSRRRLIAGFSALAGAALAGLGIRNATARYYDGPVSDHFDGRHFFDPNGSPPKSPFDLVRWQLADGKEKWPEWAPSPYRDKPPPRIDGPAWRISYV